VEDHAGECYCYNGGPHLETKMLMVVLTMGGNHGQPPVRCGVVVAEGHGIVEGGAVR